MTIDFKKPDHLVEERVEINIPSDKEQVLDKDRAYIQLKKEIQDLLDKGNFKKKPFFLDLQNPVDFHRFSLWQLDPSHPKDIMSVELELFGGSILLATVKYKERDVK